MSHPSQLEPCAAVAEAAETPPAPLHPLWPDELRGASGPKTWLWHGYLAPGNLTLLTSLWKAGKTTLLSVLLSRLRNGGPLAGLALAPGNAVVVSEEGSALWDERAVKFGYQRNLRFLCRPFEGQKPSDGQWRAFVAGLGGLHADWPFQLLAIDTLSTFIPGNENSARCMLDFLLPLQRLTGLGLSVLLVHHPNKGTVVAGQAARGSGALCGHADILVEMDWPVRTGAERRRRLQAWSRHTETPAQLVVELNADGTDYLAHGDFQDEEFTRNWDRLRALLAAAGGKLTRKEILLDWPEGVELPNEVTLWRWLERAVAQGLVGQHGHWPAQRSVPLLAAGAGRKPGRKTRWRCCKTWPRWASRCSRSPASGRSRNENKNKG